MSPILIGDIQMVRETGTTTTKIAIGADITGGANISVRFRKLNDGTYFGSLRRGWLRTNCSSWKR